MNTTIKRSASGAAIAILGMLVSAPFSGIPANAACALGPSNAPNGNGMDVYCEPDPAPAPTIEHGPIIPKCMIEQNAMRPCAAEPAPPAGVDPRTRGIWEASVGTGDWVIEISGNGTFRFHSEAHDGIPPGEGTFSASNGNWSLRRSDGYTDGGAYSFRSRDTWIAAGNHGIAVWTRRK